MTSTVGNANNLQQTNLNSIGDTKNYFNNFFNQNFVVAQNVDDAIISYFEKVTNGNKDSARILASAVIFTSLAQKIDPMQTLSKFTSLNVGELNAYLTMFLNLNRIGTSYLGITNQPITSKYVSRTLLP